MAEFKGIVQIGYENLIGINRIEDIFAEKGNGKAGASFDGKVAEFENKIKECSMEAPGL